MIVKEITLRTPKNIRKILRMSKNELQYVHKGMHLHAHTFMIFNHIVELKILLDKIKNLSCIGIRKLTK